MYNTPKYNSFNEFFNDMTINGSWAYTKPEIPMIIMPKTDDEGNFILDTDLKENTDKENNNES